MQTKEVLLSGDFRYAYRRFGDPEAPAIILLMGLGMSMDAWPESLISGLPKISGPNVYKNSSVPNMYGL